MSVAAVGPQKFGHFLTLILVTRASSSGHLGPAKSLETWFGGIMKAFVRIALAAVLFSSCTKQNKNFEFIGDIDGIFSTRPQTSTHSLMVIKLQNPPLLGALTNEGKVDADLLKAVQEEQDGIMQELLKISPEIKAVFRYRMVMNGMAVVVPAAVVDQVRKLTNVVYLEDSGSFARPIQASLPLSDEIKNTLSERNSTKFIGADLAHARQVRGQGMKVGIIDTGIDYTHAMFGGAGTEEAFKAIDPS